MRPSADVMHSQLLPLLRFVTFESLHYLLSKNHQHYRINTQAVSTQIQGRKLEYLSLNNGGNSCFSAFVHVESTCISYDSVMPAGTFQILFVVPPNSISHTSSLTHTWTHTHAGHCNMLNSYCKSLTLSPVVLQVKWQTIHRYLAIL